MYFSAKRQTYGSFTLGLTLKPWLTAYEKCYSARIIWLFFSLTKDSTCGWYFYRGNADTNAQVTVSQSESTYWSQADEVHNYKFYFLLQLSHEYNKQIAFIKNLCREAKFLKYIKYTLRTALCIWTWDLPYQFLHICPTISQLLFHCAFILAFDIPNF